MEAKYTLFIITINCNVPYAELFPWHAYACEKAVIQPRPNLNLNPDTLIAADLPFQPSIPYTLDDNKHLLKCNDSTSP